ncbi:MAG: DUF2339 domain-containing protein [Bryobacteraceae bacterium]
MDSAGDERLQELIRAIARLQEQQADLTRRLWRIEQAIAIPQPAAAPAVAAPPPVSAPSPVSSSPSRPARPQFETRMGLTWINRIGAVTLVLGVGFFFKYAIDNRWIGETGRVLLGILAAIAELGAADILWRRNQGVFAQGISGTGLAILYLSAYAAYAFYHLVSLGPAFAVMALTTALAGALAWRYDAAAIAALGLFGGYATPLLLTDGRDRPWFFFSYLLLLNLGALAIARIRKWPGLEWLALIATTYLFGAWASRDFNPSKQLVATTFVLGFHGLFASSRIRSIVYASQLAVNAGIAVFWMDTVGPYPVLVLALAAAGLGIADRRKWPRMVLVSLISFWLSYRVWTMKSPPHPLPALIVPLTCAFLLFLAWIPWRAAVRKTAFMREDYLLLPLNAGSYFVPMFGLLRAGHHEYLGSIAAALAVAHLAVAYVLRENDAKWLAAGVASAFLTLAIPIQFAGFRITMAWALEAAAIAWIGRKAGAWRYAYAALAVFALILIRLVLFDAEARGTPRFPTFATVAASLWLSSRWLGGGLSLGTYAAGHIVMLWGLILQVLVWAERTAAHENLQSVQSASISILMAVYAVVLVTIGVLTRTAVNRIGGLGLIGIVVLKLYLYDVWLLVRIYRVLAFAALGALLLLTSYLYSRYRMSIENWWSDGKPKA